MMQMMPHSFHRAWLKVTAIGIGFAGPIFFLGSMDSTFELAPFSLDLLSWPVDETQSFSAPTTRFLSALTGGFLLGWGVGLGSVRCGVQHRTGRRQKGGSYWNFCVARVRQFWLDCIWQRIKCLFQYHRVAHLGWTNVETCA